MCVNSSFYNHLYGGCFGFAFCHLVSRDCCVTLPQGDTGMSAVCNCGIFPDPTHLLFLTTLGLAHQGTNC